MEETTEASTAATSHASSNMTLLRYSFNVAVALLSTVGIFGNIIVVFILVYYKNLRKKLTTTLILNQSVVDLSCSVFLLITYSYEAESPLQVYTSLGDKIVCLLLDAKYLVFCSLNASNLCLVVITLERYLMIVYPIMHRNWISKARLVAMALCAWLLGFAWNTGPTVPFVYVKDGRCVLFKWPDYKLQSTVGVVYITGTFLVPVFFFVVAYGHMLIVLSKRATQVAGESNTNKLSSAQVNVTKTMVMVTAVFLVCWTPNQIYYLLFNLGYNLRLGSVPWLITQYLCFINCCCNPFIYAFKYDGVRAVLRKKFRNLRGEELSRNASTLNTASSHT